VAGFVDTVWPGKRGGMHGDDLIWCSSDQINSNRILPGTRVAVTKADPMIVASQGKGWGLHPVRQLTGEMRKLHCAIKDEPL